MVTAIEKYNIHCADDCRMEWCPTHNIELHYQSTSDRFVYYKDWDRKFSMDIEEMNRFLEKIYNLSKSFVYIHLPK